MIPTSAKIISGLIGEEMFRRYPTEGWEHRELRIKDLKAAELEFKALLESVRWRKQDTEKAPRHLIVIERRPLYVSMVTEICVKPGSEWLPVPP
jgi:hypothetical protein